MIHSRSLPTPDNSNNSRIAKNDTSFICYRVIFLQIPEFQATIRAEPTEQCESCLGYYFMLYTKQLDLPSTEEEIQTSFLAFKFPSNRND